MPINLSGVEALVALIAVIAFLVSIGKWIQMREAIAQRVIEVDEKLKDIEGWRAQYLKETDSIFARKENCILHVTNFNDRFDTLMSMIADLKKSLDRHIEENGRRR